MTKWMQESCKVENLDFMKIDLHVHTSERSACGNSGEEDQVKAAIQSSLDAIVFTDHGKLIPWSRLKELNQKYAPFRVFGGIEISLEEDFLIIGIQDHELEKENWSYLDLYHFVQERRGYIILAHPFRYHPAIKVDIEQFPPDGIEIYSMNTPASWQPRIRELSQQYGITLFSNSDAHKTSSIGLFYNQISGMPGTDRELVDILHTGLVEISTK